VEEWRRIYFGFTIVHQSWQIDVYMPFDHAIQLVLDNGDDNDMDNGEEAPVNILMRWELEYAAIVKQALLNMPLNDEGAVRDLAIELQSYEYFDELL
jgi:hypothetical protein